MHEFVRPVAAALSVACLAAAIAIAFAGDALAQANQAPPNQTAPAPQAAPPQQPTVKPVKQMALTDKQIEGVLAAQKDMEEITAKLPDNPTPDKNTASDWLPGIKDEHDDDGGWQARWLDRPTWDHTVTPNVVHRTGTRAPRPGRRRR